MNLDENKNNHLIKKVRNKGLRNAERDLRNKNRLNFILFEGAIRCCLLQYHSWRLSKCKVCDGGLLIYSQVDSMGHESP